MAQMTWRADEELLEHVRASAAQAGQSMNEFVTTAMRTMTDPDFSAPGAERLRERLARAGLLVRRGAPVPRPDPAAVAAARREAGAGTALSDIVSAGRG